LRNSRRWQEQPSRPKTPQRFASRALSNARRGRSAQLAAAVRSQVAIADIVQKDEDDVGCALLPRGRQNCKRRGEAQPRMCSFVLRFMVPSTSGCQLSSPSRFMLIATHRYFIVLSWRERGRSDTNAGSTGAYRPASQARRLEAGFCYCNPSAHG
jgi:hypothetical protein